MKLGCLTGILVLLCVSGTARATSLSCTLSDSSTGTDFRQSFTMEGSASLDIPLRDSRYSLHIKRQAGYLLAFFQESFEKYKLLSVGRARDNYLVLTDMRLNSSIRCEMLSEKKLTDKGVASDFVSGESSEDAPQWSTVPRQSARRGFAYFLDLIGYVKSGDMHPIACRATDLPYWLSISGCEISGTPARRETSTFEVIATDSVTGRETSTSVTIDVTN